MASFAARARLRAATRGAGLVEYVALVGLISVVGMGGYRLFGDKVNAKAEAQARCVSSLSGDCTGSGVGQDSFALSRNDPPGSQPNFKTVKAAKGASYQPIKGPAFLEGTGDGRPIHPSDVSQGQLGDCYFLATIAEMAHVAPDVIERNVKRRDDGSYAVTFYEKGLLGSMKKVEVVVKPTFPKLNDGRWAFAQPGDVKNGDSELWPMIYEKAYAQWKGKGDYGKIGNGGWPSDAMTELTGLPASHLQTKNLSFDDFAKSVADGKLVEASTIGKNDAKKNKLFQDGTLVSDHAYFVTAVDSKAQTVTVRNPWGWNNAPVTLSWADFRAAFPHTYVGQVR